LPWPYTIENYNFERILKFFGAAKGPPKLKVGPYIPFMRKKKIHKRERMCVLKVECRFAFTRV
jgi:hypothetical protein